jgi:hypothetical protein
MRRALKLTIMALALMTCVRYIPVWYHTWEFNRYVQEQTARIRSRAPLREAILSKAEQHNIALTPEDISMTTADSVLRVSVDYQVPVNFYLFRKDFSFHAMGSGLLLRNNY